MQLPTTNTTNRVQIAQSLLAGAYCRVSTARQEDEETIDVQVAEIKERAAADGNTLLKENIFMDDGWTGTMLQRPGLDEMRKAAAEGKFQILYVYDRGRVARKYFYQELVIEELEDKHIRFLPIHDKEAKTDEDRLFQGMQGLFAEWERIKITERFRIAKLQRAKSGRLVNGHALYGYKIIRHPDGSKEYAIHEEEARVVRTIFRWFVKEKISLREIIKRLFDKSIPTRKRKDIRWTKGPLERILTCDSYAKGQVYFNKYEAIVPRYPIKKDGYRRIKKSSRRTRPKEDWIPYPVPNIIPDDGTFERAQEILEENKSFHAKYRKRSYMLAGLIYCGCGYRRVGCPAGKNNRYYRCAQHIYNHPRPSECIYPGINTEALDSAVWSTITAIMEDPQLLQKEAELNIKEQASGTAVAKEKYNLQQLIKKVTEEHERYVQAYGREELAFEQYRRLTRDTKHRLKSYQKQLDTLLVESQQQVDNTESATALCQAAVEELREMLKQDRRVLVRQAVKKVVVYRENVDLIMHIPLPSEALPVKFQYRAKSRHSGDVIRLFESVFRLPIPKPRKERLIVQRDALGRIVHSQPPALSATIIM